MKETLGRFVENRWFSIADLLIVLGSGVFWYRYPKYGWIILGLALLPKAISVLAGKAPFKKTVFDIPIIVFLFTAWIGAWLAYDPQRSFAKFWLILGAVLLFYSIASQKRENTWLLVMIATCFGVVITIVFLLVFDWQTHPVRIDFINRVGVAWMKARPTLPIAIIDDDFISDILLVLFPFPVTLFLHHYPEKSKNRRWLIFAALATIIFVIGLSMASIRMAIAVLTAVFMLVIWWVVYRLIELKSSSLIKWIFLIISGLVIISALVIGIRFPNLLLYLANRTSIFPGFAERIAVNANTEFLVNDFLFTGSGLGTFPGLYSKYILSIPYFYISICSSLFLQIALEQGVFGSLAFGSVLAGGALMLVRSLMRKEIKPEQKSNAYMIMASFGIFAMVGLIDAMLFTGYAIFLLFVIPGYYVFSLDDPAEKNFSKHIPDMLFGAGLVIFVVSLGGKFFSSFYANLGAVEMARVDLGGWNWEEQIESNFLEEYDSATQFFRMTAKLDDTNSTANYRLGMIAAGRSDFAEGCRYLEKAIAVHPNHHGIIKNMGFCYVWQGNFDKALPYLKLIPEAQDELNAYSWWWESQNRKDLSGYAIQMAIKLNSQ
jgi:hypothetical protein